MDNTLYRILSLTYTAEQLDSPLSLEDLLNSTQIGFQLNALKKKKLLENWHRCICLYSPTLTQATIALLYKSIRLAWRSNRCGVMFCILCFCHVLFFCLVFSFAMSSPFSSVSSGLVISSTPFTCAHFSSAEPCHQSLSPPYLFSRLVIVISQILTVTHVVKSGLSLLLLPLLSSLFFGFCLVLVISCHIRSV